MRDKKKFAIACAGMACEILFKKKKKRRFWSKRWFLNRDKYSDVKLLQELRENDPTDFTNYLRMDSSTFDELLKMIYPYLKKEDTNMRSSIPPEERLITTLRFLATGRSYECLKFSTGISPQTIGRIVPETCKIIYNVLRKDYMKFPRTKQEWKDISERFASRWQFPNCGGSLDGKHIRIVCPANSGALYYNYKKFYSIVLLALVNADYEFIFVDAGKNGRNSDCAILEFTRFYLKLQNNSLNLPPQEENVENMNFVFVGDEGFALHEHIMKPYCQSELTYERRVFNYRLSRARNVVENTFGLITSRFRVLQTPINTSPEKVQDIIMCICVLHNFLRRKSKSYFNSKSIDSEDKQTHDLKNDAEWRKDATELHGLEKLHIKNTTLTAKQTREHYLQYFNGAGTVAWQDNMIRKGKA